MKTSSQHSRQDRDDHGSISQQPSPPIGDHAATDLPNAGATGPSMDPNGSDEPEELTAAEELIAADTGARGTGRSLQPGGRTRRNRLDTTRETRSAVMWGDQTRPTARHFGWILLVCGLLGEAAAFILAVEKFWLLTNPFYTPSCNVGATVNCGTVMTSAQAEAFGFPNPLIGIAGFAVLATVGAARLAAVQFSAWLWIALQAGVSLAVVFVHWLIFQSIAVIGSLCPYCMIVWAVTITAFWYVSLRNLTHAFQRRQEQPVIVGIVQRYHSTLLAVWLLALAAGVTLSVTLLR